MFRLRSDDKYYLLNLNGIQTEKFRLCSVCIPMIKIIRGTISTQVVASVGAKRMGVKTPVLTDEREVVRRSGHGCAHGGQVFNLTDERGLTETFAWLRFERPCRA